MKTKPPSMTSATPPPPSRRVGWLHRLRNKVIALRRLHERERRRLREEFSRVPGLMALLMKPRNGQPWTRADRDTLRAHLRGMHRLGLYLAVMLLPGATITLPLLAWWLDRRHARRLPGAAPELTTSSDAPDLPD